jgi:hypothetical protein
VEIRGTSIFLFVATTVVIVISVAVAVIADDCPVGPAAAGLHLNYHVNDALDY